MALSTRSSSQDPSTPDQQQLDVTRARQGRLGRPVLWVLLCSLALVVIGFAIAWSWKAGDLAGASTKGGAVQSQADARRFSAPAPQPVNPQPYQKGTDPSTNPTRP